MEARSRTKREYIILFKESEVEAVLGILGLITKSTFFLSKEEKKLISDLTSELRQVTTLED